MKLLTKLLLVALIAFFSYEAFAVIDARSKTKEIFSSILNSESIEIKLRGVRIISNNMKEKLNLRRMQSWT